MPAWLSPPPRQGSSLWRPLMQTMDYGPKPLMHRPPATPSLPKDFFPQPGHIASADEDGESIQSWPDFGTLSSSLHTLPSITPITIAEVWIFTASPRMMQFDARIQTVTQQRSWHNWLPLPNDLLWRDQSYSHTVSSWNCRTPLLRTWVQAIIGLVPSLIVILQLPSTDQRQTIPMKGNYVPSVVGGLAIHS